MSVTSSEASHSAVHDGASIVDEVSSPSPATGVTTDAGARHLASDKRDAPPPLDTVKGGEDHTLPWRPWRRATTPWSVLVDADYKGSGTDDDPFLVTWLDAAVDPENPMTMPDAHKWGLTVFVSLATLVISLSSSAYSGATRPIMRDLGGSTEVVTLGLFVLGFAIGPLFWAPLSEVLGRRLLYIVSYGFLTLWTGVALASPNIGALVAFRFLQGAFGSSPLTNSGGSVSDVFAARQRGLAVSLFAAAPFTGPALGPIVGGFLAVGTDDWKPMMAFLTAFCGVFWILGIFLYTETYAPLLLRQRAERLSRHTGRRYISMLDEGRDVRLSTQFRTAMLRPWQLLLREPIVLVTALYIAVIYATLYSFFAAFPLVFQQVRGWNAGESGLAFLGILLGMMVGLVIVVVWENPRYIRISMRSPGGVAPPEARLTLSKIGALLIPLGLAGFAATDSPSIHWSAPILLSSLFGTGMIFVFLSINNYLVDSYLLFAASVLAANAVIRSLFGAAFPLFTRYMYAPSPSCPLATCGIHVGPAISAGMALLGLPFPFLFARYGRSIRERCKYAAEAARMAEKLQSSNIKQQRQQQTHEPKSTTTSPSSYPEKPSQQQHPPPTAPAKPSGAWTQRDLERSDGGDEP